jgi:hypothetical protein
MLGNWDSTLLKIGKSDWIFVEMQDNIIKIEEKYNNINKNNN